MSKLQKIKICHGQITALINAVTSPVWRGQKDTKKVAQHIYDAPICQNLFQRAWTLYPRFNTTQADAATDFIHESLVYDAEEQGAMPKSKAGQDAVSEELYEMISAGLT